MDEKKLQQKALTKTIRRFYGIADFGFSGYTGMMTNFWNFFLSDIMKLPLTMVATVATVPLLVNTYSSPFYGLIMQKVKALKWGKIRSWFIIAPPITLIFFTLCFSGIGLGTVWAGIFIIIVRSLAPISWNISWTANAAMLNVLSVTSEDRVKLSRNKQMGSSLANTLWAVAIVPMAGAIGKIVGTQVGGYTVTAFFIASIAVVCFLIMFKITEGYDTVTKEQVAKKEKQEKVRLIDTLKAIYKNPQLLVTLLVALGWHTVNYVMVGLVVYYFTYVAENIALLALNNLIATGISVIAAYFGGIIGTKLGIKRAAILSSVIMAGSLVVAKFLAVDSAIAFIICFTIMKIGYGIGTVLLNAMFSSCAVYGEYVSGEDQSLFIMSLQQTPLILSGLIRGIITNVLLATSGYVVGQVASYATKVSITNALCLGPAIIACITLVVVFFYTLNDKKILELTEAIANRKAV